MLKFYKTEDAVFQHLSANGHRVMAKWSQVFDTRLRNIFGNIEQMEKRNNNKTAEMQDLGRKIVHLGDEDKD